MRTSGPLDQTRTVPVPAPAPAHPPPFREIFENEFGFVWNTLRRCAVPERDLEDVAHDVFVVVDRKLGDFDTMRPLRPWLFAIAYQTASDYRRRARHKRELLGEEPSEPIDTAERADDRLERAEEDNLARRALGAVPEARRVVVLLHDFDEVPMQDVADALEIPLKTAYSRLRVGREELLRAARRLQEAP